MDSCTQFLSLFKLRFSFYSTYRQAIGFIEPPHLSIKMSLGFASSIFFFFFFSPDCLPLPLPSVCVSVWCVCVCVHEQLAYSKHSLCQTIWALNLSSTKIALVANVTHTHALTARVCSDYILILCVCFFVFFNSVTVYLC